jgi:hypothetical protein
MANSADANERARQAQRKIYIAGAVSRFFARYKTPPTAEKIKADARRFKSRLDPFAYKRIIAAANKLTPAAAAARPAPPNASIYFDTPGTPGAGTAAADTPGGGLDPLPFILGGLALVFLLRR